MTPLLTALLLTLGSVSQAIADPIRGPVTATTTMGVVFPLVHAIDQTGLSATYVSGVTDFATFTASTTHHSQPGNDWMSLTTFGSVTFDLGSLIPVDEVAIWNFGGVGVDINLGITRFTLLASTDAGFLSPTTLGTFKPRVSAITPNPAQIFGFAPTTAQFFRVQDVRSLKAGSIGLGEIAFGRFTTATPTTAATTLIPITGTLPCSFAAGARV
jgi:hypothetical protein